MDLLLIFTCSYCQKCIDLTIIDITYDGEFSEFEEETESSAYEDDVERHFTKILPSLTWMKSLKSLVLLKHDPFYNWDEDCVTTSVLDAKDYVNDPWVFIAKMLRLYLHISFSVI